MKSMRSFFAGWKEIEFSPVFIGAILLGFAAWQNMYPLVYPDTGSYIMSGLDSRVPVDRPILYGLFLRHTSMRATMWLAFFAQSLIVSSVLFAFVKTYFSNHRYHVIYYFIITPLITCTALSIKTSTLIPDAFTPLPILCFFILKHARQPKMLRLWFMLVMVFCIGTHQSHIMILFGALVLYLLADTLKAGFKSAFQRLRSVAFMIPVIAGSFFITPLLNVIYAGEFYWSKSGGIFMMGRLADNGLLQTYLRENCGKKPLEMCNYIDHIPVDFLWDSSSPLHKMGGWEHPNPEYGVITRDILTTPRYLIPFIYKSVSSSIVQFFYFPIIVRAENAAMSFDTPPHYALSTAYKHEIGLYTFSNQNINRLDYTDLDNRQLWLLTVLVVLFAAVKISSLAKYTTRFTSIFLLILFYTISNAVVCGTLSIPNPRYQTRVFWLLPMMMMIVLIHLWLNHRKEVLNIFRGTSPQEES